MSSTSNKFILAAAAVFAATLAAQSADLKVKKPVYKAPPARVALVSPWAGPYMGVHVGYGWGDTTSTGAAGLPFALAPGAGVGLSPQGWLGGLQFGNNWMIEQYLLGLEMDFGYLGLSDSATVAGRFAGVDYSWYGTVTGRLGITFDNALLYAKGGLALARINNSAGAVGLPTDFTSASGVRTGWTVGGGLEYALDRQWSVKGEYLYMDFGDTSSSNLDGDTFTHANTIHTFKIGLNYRFGSAGFGKAPVVSAKY